MSEKFAVIIALRHTVPEKSTVFLEYVYGVNKKIGSFWQHCTKKIRVEKILRFNPDYVLELRNEA
jgi:hypothetical protein